MDHSTTTSASSNVQNQTLPVIAGHEIAMDEHGRFNLNAIHHASGTGKGKMPSNWARSSTALEQIQELESNSSDLRNSEAPVLESRKGRYGGTYAHELLAVSYAGWISPKFQLQVNQVFLDYRMGKLHESEQQQALPNPLSPRHQRDLQKAISSRVYAEVPKPYRKAAFSKVYRHLKDRFDVAKYDQIDDSRYTEALGAVQSVSLEGEWIEAKPEPLGTPLSDRQLYDVYFIAHHFAALKAIFERYDMYHAFKLLGSRAGIEMIDHFTDGYGASCRLRNQLDAEFDAVQRRLRLNHYAAM